MLRTGNKEGPDPARNRWIGPSLNVIGGLLRVLAVVLDHFWS